MKSDQVAAATALLCGGVGASVPHDILLGRWRLALDLFGRVFVDDVGLEPGSIISELGGFPVKVRSLTVWQLVSIINQLSLSLSLSLS